MTVSHAPNQNRLLVALSVGESKRLSPPHLSGMKWESASAAYAGAGVEKTVRAWASANPCICAPM
jgi:hypothetical protein